MLSDEAHDKNKSVVSGAPREQHRNRGFASRLLIGIASAFCIILFQNCGTDFVPMTDTQLAALGKFSCGSTMQETFAKTYQSFGRANCVACHGVSQTPKFAMADSSIAFAEFAKTNQTTFASYATNPGHGGGAGKTENAATIQRIQAQYDGCKGGGGGVVDTVTARTQPLPLNATADIALRTFDNLDSQLELGATNLGGAKLHFEVRADLTQSVPAYIIARPSLQTGSATVAVKGITIRINGVRIPAATAFTMVDRVINPGANPINNGASNGNISTGSAVFEYPGANPATDTVQFEFQVLKAQ